jgi:hypothetical protein
MRRLTVLFAAMALVIALTSCVIIDHGADMPPDSAYADARFYDPWNGINHPLLGDNMRRDMRRF